MAEEAKIKVVLEGIEEAKATAASARASASQAAKANLEGDDDDENPFADEDAGEANLDKNISKTFFVNHRKSTYRIMRRHRAAAKATSAMAQQRLQMGAMQMRSGSPMGMLLGGNNIYAASQGPGGLIGAARGIGGNMMSNFSGGSALMRGNMIYQGARMAGAGASFLSDRGLTGGGGNYNPIELVATIKREFDIFWAKKTGEYGGVKDAASSAFILGEPFTDKMREGYGARSKAEAEYDATEEKIFGRNERKLEFDAKVAGWIEMAQHIIGLPDSDLKALGSWFRKVLDGGIGAVMGDK